MRKGQKKQSEKMLMRSAKYMCEVEIGDYVTLKIPDLSKQVSVRQAAGLVDIGGGQGMLKCNCQGDCSRRICTCRNHKVLCNSRCHAKNTSCLNK